MKEFIEDYIDNSLDSSSACFQKKNRFSIYSELRKVFNDLDCVPIVERLEELDLFSIVFDSSGPAIFRVDDFIFGLELIDRLFDSQLFECLKCDRIPMMDKHKANRNLFVYHCSSDALSVWDLPKLVKSNESLQYLKSIYYFSPPDLDDEDLFEEINQKKEDNSHYPMLIAFLADFMEKLSEEATSCGCSCKQLNYPESSDALDNLIEYLEFCARINGCFISKKMRHSQEMLQHRNNFFAQCIKIAVEKEDDSQYD